MNFLFFRDSILLLRVVVRPDDNLHIFSFEGWQGLWQLGVEGNWKAVLSRRCYVWNINVNGLLLVPLLKILYILSKDTINIHT